MVMTYISTLPVLDGQESQKMRPLHGPCLFPMPMPPPTPPADTPPPEPLAALARPFFEPIAIVGMGMRLPGGVHDATSYWDLLVNGRSGRSRVPKSRFDIDAWHNIDCQYGHFLSTDDDEDTLLSRLDASFWTSLSRHEAETMDPRHRLLLEVVHEAFETAGATGWRGSETGVYVGEMGFEWQYMAQLDAQARTLMRPEVHGDYVTANRVSYEFDLKGPSMTVRTACSASIVALNMACRDMHSGNCKAAIVGGVNLVLSPRDHSVFAQHGVLSSTGDCRSFDADGDGYLRGEAVSAIYIKPLADAVRDGDPIRAVIRSTCVSNDGRSNGMTVPDPAMHERTMRRAYEMAGIRDLSQTAMVECHATGTAVGDPLEANAVARVWGEAGMIIGSVKPNIGHGEGASGISSILKMVLALENRTIPPNINFKTPNPQIPWKEAKLTVPTRAMPWPVDRLERVSINSFGIGGTNAHIILESAACYDLGSNPHIPYSPPRLLPFSAKHPAVLTNSAAAVQKYLVEKPQSLGDVAYSLATRRETHTHRAFAVVTESNNSVDLSGFETLHQADKPAPGSAPSVIWVFTGQGAQWAQMGKELIEREPVVRQRIDHLDAVLAGLSNPPAWSIRGEIAKPKSDSRIHDALFSQPCLAALQIALVDLLRSWGVTPSAVVGHSSGETAAAYAVGAITAEDAILLAYYRGQYTTSLKRAHSGGMAAVGLGAAQLRPLLRPGVIVGCDNSPGSVTLSGDRAALDAVMDDVRSRYPDVMCRAVRVECAYHYAGHMRTVVPEFERNLAGPDGVRTTFRPPRVPFYSSVTASRVEDISPALFVRNIVSPVLFHGAVRALLDDFSSPVFVEIGPHSAMAGPVRHISQSHHIPSAAAQPPPQYIPTLVRNRDDSMACLREAAGNLWLAGAAVDLGAINPPGDFLPDLPTYKWHYEPGRRYWSEPRISRELRAARFGHHEILGSRVVETGDACPAWRCRLAAGDVPWLRDHVYMGDVLFPAAGYIAMAGEAVRRLASSRGNNGSGSPTVVDYSLRHVRFVAPLFLAQDTIEMVTSLMPVDLPVSSEEKWYRFSISSIKADGDDVWTTHATGQCRSGRAISIPNIHSIPEPDSMPRRINTESSYRTWKRHGLEFGPLFRRLVSASSQVGDDRMEAAGMVNAWFDRDEKRLYYPAMHPSVIDAGFHVSIQATCRGLDRNFTTLSVPHSIREMYVGEPVNSDLRLVANIVEQVEGSSQTTCDLAGKSGLKVVFCVRGLEVTHAGQGLGSVDEDPHAGHVLEWRPDIDFVQAEHLAVAADNLPNETDCEDRDIGFDLSTFLAMLSHKIPNRRILEISLDGKVERTLAVLQSLETLENDSKRRPDGGSYTVACLDDQDLASAKARTTGPDVQYAQFDISKSTGRQSSFDQQPFDLLIVDGRIFSSPSSPSSGLLTVLTNARRMMQSCGRLLILGAQTNEDLTPVLSQAGFDAEESIMIRKNGKTTMISMARGGQAPSPPKQKRLSVLAQDTSNPLIVKTAASLKAHGYALDWYLPGQLLPPSQPTLGLLDLEGGRSFLDDMTPDNWVAIKTSLLSLQDTNVSPRESSCSTPVAPQLLWVTAACQVECEDPNYSLALGFLRSVRREAGLDVVTLELDAFEDAGLAVIARVLDHRFGQRSSVGDQGYSAEPDSEYAFSRGRVMISRLKPISVLDELEEKDDKNSSSRTGQPGRRKACLKPDVMYVIVGGVGGLGLASGRFLVERGARNLLFFSRSAEKFVEKNPEIVREFEAMGCHIQAVSGSVDKMEDVAMMLTKFTLPVAGVLHSAMVLHDENLPDMTFSHWDGVLRPKVKGAWTLHSALLAHQPDRPLDFFVLFSSLNGLGGQIRQANYAAANSFLDAFAQHRRGRGLACSVLDIGLMEDVGVLSRDRRRLAALRAEALHCLHERELLDALELVLLESSCERPRVVDRHGAYFRSEGQLALGLGHSVRSADMLRGALGRSGWVRDPRLLLHHVTQRWSGTGGGGTDAPGDDATRLKGILQMQEMTIDAVDEGAWLLGREIVGALRGFMMRDDDVDVEVAASASLGSLGVDSLIGVELRNWLRRKYGVSGLSVQEIRQASSPMALGRLAVERMVAMREGGLDSRLPAGISTAAGL